VSRAGSPRAGGCMRLSPLFLAARVVEEENRRRRLAQPTPSFFSTRPYPIPGPRACLPSSNDRAVPCTPHTHSHTLLPLSPPHHPPSHTRSSTPLRAALALAALAATFATKLAFPSLSARLATPSMLCDPAVGCTPAQLAAKRAPKPLASYAHHSLQAAWGRLPAEVELVDIVDAVLPAGARGGVVNLGARDGKTHDPTYPLFARGHPGAAFEGWEPVFPELDAHLGPFAPGVAVVHEYARPDTFAAKLKEAGVTPANLDVLKIGERGEEEDIYARARAGTPRARPLPIITHFFITKPQSLSLSPISHFLDIDGFDLALARSVLEAGYRPKVVLMEINSDVPAPFVFETQFREGWELYFG